MLQIQPNSFSSLHHNLLASSVQQSLGMLLNPIFSPLVPSSNNTTTDQQNLLTNKRRYTDSSNESSSSKCQYMSSDVVNVFANQLITNNSSKSQISTCTLCGKKFQSNDYLQLHLMNKHQIKTDIQQKTNKLNHLITTSNQSNTYKKIKLEPNETTTSTQQTSSPTNTSTVIPGIVDTYFAAKMADRVSCDICQKVNHHTNLIIIDTDYIIYPTKERKSSFTWRNFDQKKKNSESRIRDYRHFCQLALSIKIIDVFIPPSFFQK